MCAIEGAEPWDFVHDEQRTARKTHRCYECDRAIHPGERYHILTGLYDGRWSTERTCKHCAAAGVWMQRVCGGYLTGGLLEELVEHWHEGYRSIGLGRLIAGIRHRWHDGRDAVPEGVSEMADQMLAAAVA